MAHYVLFGNYSIYFLCKFLLLVFFDMFFDDECELVTEILRQMLLEEVNAEWEQLNFCIWV